jgi:putative flavoprotein involved in K+ transport
MDILVARPDRAFDRPLDSIDDVAAARREPSLQLVGRPDRGDLDLATLQAAGVRLVDGCKDGRGAVTLGRISAGDRGG